MAFTYKGLTAQLTHHTVTEEETQRQLLRLVQQNPRITQITDRTTELGDEVVLDYAGFCGQEQFAGGTAQNQTLTLGSGAFIPGFEDQLLGKRVGEQVTVLVTFPESYHAPELAGKEARFECTIHQIRIQSPYELNDEFAKEVGGCDTLEQMKEKLQQSLQAYTDERGEMDLQDRLLRQAAESLDFQTDDAALEKAVDEQMQAFEAQLARQGLNMEMYCAFANTTAEEIRKDSYPTAKLALQTQAAVEEIVRLEQLEASQEEIGQAIALVARQNGMTTEELKPYYTPDFEKALLRSIMTSKVMQLIRDNATITNC